jgi:hypothetical protein
MNIKIFTFHYTNNYGALLQSLCLKEFLRDNFNLKIEFARYIPKKLFFREIYSPLITKNPFVFYQFLKKNYFLSKWKKKMNLQSPKFTTEINNPSISVYGSDSIWAVSYFGFEPYYFGEKNDAFKITYAVSIGPTDINKLDNYQKKKIKILLNSYDFISVRDYNTANLVKVMTGSDPLVVVDPIFLSTPKFINYSFNNTKKKLKKYAIIYGAVFSNKDKEKILNYCKKENLQSISIGYKNNWVDKNYIAATPEDLVAYLSQANSVFTSMFHGVMLSVKLRKQFWYSIDPIRTNKLSYFIDHLDLSSRLLSNSENLNANFDYALIENKLFDWIKLSKEYLINSINKSGLIK